VNLILDENYLYLRAKPHGDTLLDAFGAWPIYLVVVEGIALVLFVAAGALARAVLTGPDPGAEGPTLGGR